ncbi:MAG: TldD/PmbA family protein [Armatimonadota bacterium]|nr:TldD/PmbA family protein [bacterium]
MKDMLKSICGEAGRKGASFADVRIYQSEGTGIVRQDGRADKLDQSSVSGLGIRVLKDCAWGFASVSGLDRDAAFEALDAAIAMAEASSARSEDSVVTYIPGIEDVVRAEVEIDPRSVTLERKMAALQCYEQAAIELVGSKMANSITSYRDAAQREIVCNTFGTYIETEIIRTRMTSMVVARDGSLLQRGSKVVAAPRGFELVESTSAQDFTLKAASLAVSLLSASPPPAGRFPVIFHPSVTGLLTHEAIGHNAEADHILSGTSIIAGKLGTRVGSELVTIVDDSTLPGEWGSYKYDSEGTPGQRRVIVDRGILRGYMHSLETAAKLGAAPNGSARAQDYSQRPIIRMSNTFVEPGESTFEDMVKGMDLGIYLKGGQHGHVYSERGQFTCHAGEAYMIRHGEIAEHLRDVSVAGMTLETLMNIDAVSNDFEMDSPGMCGKNGQSMYIDNGGPHIRVKELVVGGRN